MPTIATIGLTIGIPGEILLCPLAGFGDAFSGGMKCSPKAMVDLDEAGAASLTVAAPTWSLAMRYADTDVVL